MKRAGRVAFSTALAVFLTTLALTIDKGTDVSCHWLIILWTAFGVSFLIGVASLNPVWNRLSRIGARIPLEIRRKPRRTKATALDAPPREHRLDADQRAAVPQNESHSPALVAPTLADTPEPPTFAGELALLYHRGRELHRVMQVHTVLRPREHLAGQAGAAQVQRERWVRAWDNSVQGALVRHDEGHAFVARWGLAGRLPAEHTTLVLIEPTLPHDKLIGHMAGKLDCLKGIIKELGETDSQLHEPDTGNAPDEDASSVPDDPRRAQRLALGDEAEQLGAELDGMLARWLKAVRADPAEGGKVVGEYLERFRVRTVALFEELVAQGLADPASAPTIREPPDADAVANIAELLREVPARLRLRNPALAAWLEECIDEVRGFQRELREQIARPLPDIDRTDSIQDNFRALNNDVIRRLRRDAPPWVGYYHESPDWFHGGLTRLTGEQFEEVVRAYEYAIGQLARIAEQVR